MSWALRYQTTIKGDTYDCVFHLSVHEESSMFARDECTVLAEEDVLHCARLPSAARPGPRPPRGRPRYQGLPHRGDRVVPAPALPAHHAF